MNNYKNILFEHLDGIVLIPTIVALDHVGILNSIFKLKKFNINAFKKKLI